MGWTKNGIYVVTAQLKQKQRGQVRNKGDRFINPTTSNEPAPFLASYILKRNY
jgi:hypothetical protein